MNDFNQIFTAAQELFLKQEYAASLLKLSEADMLLAAAPVDSLILNVENLKGFIYLAINDYESARECFETSININPKYSQAYIGMGEVFLQRDRLAEAKIMFERGVLNDPDNQQAKSYLAKANMQLGLPQFHNGLNA